MNRQLLTVLLVFTLAPAAPAKNKESQRLDKAAKALQEIVSTGNGLQRHILDQALCVLIFPSVKKVAFGIGDSYGRGVLLCRKGPEMKADWGAPVMFALDQGSLGVQFGTTATDFVLVVVSQKGVEQVLSGKVKLGTGANVTAGPVGAEASKYSVSTSKADVLSYSRSKGVFAGVSLSGASMVVDDDANTSLYAKEVTPDEIVKGDRPIPDAATALVDLLDVVSYVRNAS